MIQGNSKKHPVHHFRQVIPARNAIFKVETRHELVFDVLRITNESPREIEIEAVHVDAAFPLRIAVRDTPELLHLAEFPLTIAYGSSLALLLRTPSSSPIIQRFAYPRTPEKAIVTTGMGLVIFASD